MPIDWVFWVPTSTGDDGKWMFYNAFPASTKKFLKQKIVSDYCSMLYHAHEFDRWVRRREHYIKDGNCLTSSP